MHRARAAAVHRARAAEALLDWAAALPAAALAVVDCQGRRAHQAAAAFDPLRRGGIRLQCSAFLGCSARR